jgi:hypothetical protein
MDQREIRGIARLFGSHRQHKGTPADNAGFVLYTSQWRVLYLAIAVVFEHAGFCVLPGYVENFGLPAATPLKKRFLQGSHTRSCRLILPADPV